MAKKRTESEEDYNKRQIKLQIDTYFRLKAMMDDTLTAILASVNLSALPFDKPIKIEKYEQLYKAVNGEIKKLNVTMYDYIRDTTRESWNLANSKATDQVNSEFAKRGLAVPSGMKSKNIGTYNQFVKRKTGELTISGRVWNVGQGYTKEIEQSINAAIQEGKSARDVARDIKKYLNNPDARYKRIRDKAGELKLSANAMQYHPGRGVYRSAFQNALRLARNEINLAFHSATMERYRAMPFVIGYTIQNSRNRVSTVCEICKSIDGVAFPKSIQVLPVHVQCLCTTTSIMCSDEEFEKIKDGYVPKEIPLKGKAREHVNKYLTP